MSLSNVNQKLTIGLAAVLAISCATPTSETSGTSDVTEKAEPLTTTTSFLAGAITITTGAAIALACVNIRPCFTRFQTNLQPFAQMNYGQIVDEFRKRGLAWVRGVVEPVKQWFASSDSEIVEKPLETVEGITFYSLGSCKKGGADFMPQHNSACTLGLFYKFCVSPDRTRRCECKDSITNIGVPTWFCHAW